MSIAPDAPPSLSPVDRAVLPVMRHFLDAFSEPETFAWRTGYSIAIQRWGEARGLAIANAVQVFLVSVLSKRPVPLQYNDPLDVEARQTLTQDEADLLVLLEQLRQDSARPARETIAKLTGGHVRASIVQAGLKLSQLLGPDTHVRSSQPRPKLRCVT